MSQLYPTARQLGIEPSKPLPASRPARPAKPIKPAKGAQQKASMLTPWDRKVTVKRSDVPEKQKHGYEFQGYKTVPPQGLNKPRPAVKQQKPPVKSKDVDYVPFNEMRSFKEIIESIESEC